MIGWLRRGFDGVGSMADCGYEVGQRGERGFVFELV